MLWVGGTLSPIERLSIASWVECGFPVELYAYDEVGNVPAGCAVQDASAILPREAIFAHAEATGRSKGSFAGFADVFRWHLLYQKGGFWSDCDVVCLKRFELPRTLAIGSEFAQTQSINYPAITNCFFGGPPGHRLFAAAIEAMQEKDLAQSKWGEFGTQLIGQLVDGLNFEDHVLPCRAFNPIGPYRMIGQLFGPEGGRLSGLLRESWGLHLYNEVWRSNGISKQGPFPRDSLIHSLFARYGVEIGVEPALPFQMMEPAALAAQ